MKGGLKQIIGKEVGAVVFAQSPRDPRLQVFLVFRDGTCFEFYGHDFNCRAELDPAGRLEDYVESAGGRIVRVYGDIRRTAAVGGAPKATPARPKAAPAKAEADSVESLMAKDLISWWLAKSVIAKAKSAD